MTMSTGWNFTIDDSSSFISYYPFEDGGLGNRTLVGWEPYWSGSGGFPTQFADDASGQSWLITALDGASLRFQFYGDAVYLHGTTNGTFDVAIDNAASNNLTAMGNLLYYVKNLQPGTHYVTLIAHFTPNAGQLMQFDLANATYTFKDESGAPQEVMYENTNGTAFQYTGQWSVASALDVPTPTSTAPYHVTSQFGSSASMNFTGGEAIAVYGFRDWGNWIYNVTLDGYQYQFNGSTPWKQGNSLLFFQAGLDPNQTHTIVLTDEADQSYWQFMLNSISVFRSNITTQGNPTASGSAATSSSASTAVSDADKPSTNIGAIIGGVMGGVVGLLLIAILLIRLLRRRAVVPADMTPFPTVIVSETPVSGSYKNPFAPFSGMPGPPTAAPR